MAGGVPARSRNCPVNFRCHYRHFDLEVLADRGPIDKWLIWIHRTAANKSQLAQDSRASAFQIS